MSFDSSYKKTKANHEPIKNIGRYGSNLGSLVIDSEAGKSILQTKIKIIVRIGEGNSLF